MGIMSFHSTPLAGVFEVGTRPTGDDRGQFFRAFCDEEFRAVAPGIQWRQINISETSLRGTVRGLHFQHPPVAEVKLVRCLRGEVFDVAVDLRAGSPTFGRWHAVHLSAEKRNALLIPEGYAHGFQAMTDDVQMLYMHSMPWTRASEDRIRYDDPMLAIAWPQTVTQISESDVSARTIDENFKGIQL